jgi:predicted dehydrogenase
MSTAEKGCRPAKIAPDGAEYADHRQVLGRKDIDAVVIGSRDHWHVPMTIDSIQAGKDVYVESPSHTPSRGARCSKPRLHRQIIQVGYQQRSWPHFQQARQILASGKLSARLRWSSHRGIKHTSSSIGKSYA